MNQCQGNGLKSNETHRYKWVGAKALGGRMTNWKIKEVDGEEREWPKETRAEVEEALEEFDWMDLMVISPTGEELSREEFLNIDESGTEQLQEPEIVEEAEAIAEQNEPNVSKSEAYKQMEDANEEIAEKMKEGYEERNDIEPAKGGENAPTPTENAVPEPSQLTSDPLDVISKNADQFTDNIRGKTTINRQGYAVLAERFNISVEAKPVTLPSESDFEYSEFKAVATTEDGQTYTGFGSAHVNRDDGDDKHLLAELAETRAMKRATAWATGVGMTAMEELQNEL
jgi:hypothetical protein